jgi:hypothetical protein
MLKRTMSAFAIAAIASVGVAAAQENATITLKSGERLQGQLIDMGGSGFQIKVNNQDRQVPTGDVAIIDFTGGTMSADDWNKVSAGQTVTWLRNGQTVIGQLYDIGGTSPLRITLKTDGGDRELSSNEIGRIVLARTDAAAAAATGTTSAGTANTASTSGGAIVVNGNQAWTQTGIMVRRGERLTFNTTGEVRLNSAGDDIAQPAGATSGRKVAGAPMPNAIVGALIGRIGNGQPFGIGNMTSVVMPASGMLFLGVNDDHVGDNTGEFRVEIVRAATRR